MATAISKLRKEFYNEQKAKRDMMKDIVIERKPVNKTEIDTTSKFKMVVNPEKLEKTIQKACIPIQKKCINVLEKIPPTSNKNPVPNSTAVSVVICQARNLNGTPCKCKAKIGKFCAKHAP